MKKYHLIILLFLPYISIAQSNYKSGYVINLKGDTLRGYIDYKEWGRNPQNINFKITPVGKGHQFGLTDISYFEIIGHVSYRKYAVAISLNAIDISSPSSPADTASVTDTVFLKILEKGKNVTLFGYKDNLKERFYLKDNTTDVVKELQYGIYQDPNSDSVINKNTYKAQLNEMVLKYNQWSDDLTKQIQQSPYKEDQLTQIVAQINGNTQKQASLKVDNSTALRFFAGGSFISSTLNDGQYYGRPASTSNSPKISIGGDMIINPDIGHLVFRLEMAYTANNFSFTDSGNPIYNIADPVINYITVKQTIVSIAPQVIYNLYNANNVKVFFDLGYSFNFTSYPTNTDKAVRYGQPAVTEGDDALQYKDSYDDIMVKTGIVLYKRFEIYGAYFTGADINNSLTFTTNLSSYQVGLNYFFGKAAH